MLAIQESTRSGEQLELFSEFPYVSIENLNPNQIGGTVISLFSGAGGLDLGFECAGFETLACVELDPDSRATLRHNRPNWKLIDGTGTQAGDIRFVSGTDILYDLGLARGEVTVVAGGPPCQSFSNLGLRRGKNDPVNGDLYQHYLRIVEEILPQSIVFENVEGFNHRQHEGVRQELLFGLERLGYKLSCGVLLASNYGDPQLRKRFVVLGIRTGPKPKLPAPTHFPDRESFVRFNNQSPFSAPTYRPYVTVRQALNTLGNRDPYQSDDLKMGVSTIVKERMKLIGPGQNFKVLPDRMLPDCWKSGRHQGADTFGRLSLDKPSVTIRTSAYNPAKGRYIHPTENRGLSTREMAALQSFPPEFRFVCARGKPTLVGIGRMIGNAVPIRLGTAIGLALRACLDNR